MVQPAPRANLKDALSGIDNPVDIGPSTCSTPLTRNPRHADEHSPVRMEFGSYVIRSAYKTHYRYEDKDA